MKYLFSFAWIIIVSFVLVSCGNETSSNGEEPEETENKNPFKKEGTLTLISQPASDSSRTKVIEIEIADTEAERQKGLMYRKSMKMNRGMLFVFEEEKPQSFWMKNTAIYLDMAFINSALEIVAIQKNVPIFTEEGRNSKGLPAKYVLEVNAGFMDNYGFKEGDKVSYTKD